MAEATAYGNKLANDINERDKKRIADAGKAKIQKLTQGRSRRLAQGDGAGLEEVRGRHRRAT